MQKVSFLVDRQKVTGTLFYPEKIKAKNPAILFVHGWTSNQEKSFQYAETLSKLGFICFLFDMRGHGSSEGDISKSTPKEFLRDVLAAYDYLVSLEEVDPRNISGVGSSFGCYLLAIASKKKSFKRLALRVPADYPNEVFDKAKMQNSGSNNSELVEWRKQPKKSHETFALQAISHYVGEVLVIEAEKDTIVPHETIVNYLNSMKKAKQVTHIIMKDSPHSISPGRFRDEYEQILIDWFKDKI